MNQSPTSSIPVLPKPTQPGNRLDSLDVLRGFAVLAIFAVNIKMMASGFNHYRDIGLYEGVAAPWIGFVHSRLIDGKFLTIFTALFGAGLALLLDRDSESRVPFARLSARSLFAIGLTLQVTALTYYVAFPVSETVAPILWRATPDAHEEVASIMLGPVGGQVAARIEAAPYYMFDLFLRGGVWIDTLGTMLFGMALIKTGFLGGKLPVRSYVVWGSVGLVIASIYYLLRPFLDAEKQIQGLIRNITGYSHRFGAALVWSSLIIAAVAGGWQGRRLAAVGRTAFTVYILQSVIGLLLFTSLGLGLFGQLSLPQLTATTLVTWAFFLYAAPLWLRYFRFGPLEWAWRSLTYRNAEPLRR